jgi:hypothetical protein
MGGKNNITNTNHTLNQILRVYNPKSFLLAQEGFFGDPWNERTNLAENTDDLNKDFLSAKFLPMTLFAFGGKPFGTMEDQAELMPMSILVHEYASKRKVSVELTFAVHAMLIAFLNVQGDMECTRLAIKSCTLT